MHGRAPLAGAVGPVQHHNSKLILRGGENGGSGRRHSRVHHLEGVSCACDF
jgi:hypothetical protein